MSAEPEAILLAAPRGGRVYEWWCPEHHIELSGAPIEPPAEIEQNSNTPSNGGLSSPTRTLTGISTQHVRDRSTQHTPCPMIRQLLRRLWCHPMQEMDVFVCVERAHHFGCCAFRSLQYQGGFSSNGERKRGKIHTRICILSNISYAETKSCVTLIR